MAAPIPITFDSNTKTFTIQLGVFDNVGMTFTPTSEIQNGTYLQECSSQSFYLTWLNSLAVWSYWSFDGQKDYNVQIEGSRTAEKNTFQDWDDNFAGQTNGSAESKRFYQFVKAYEAWFVRSQFMTEAQADAVAKIRTAIQAQRYTIEDGSSKQTIIIDKGSFTIKRDRQDLYSLDFDAEATAELPIQKQ